MDNLAAIVKDAPQLKYVQLDDGYQPAMGDWLETGKAFGGDVQGVLQAIRKQGFEPAIWVAPFIAEAGSAPLPAAPRLVHEGRRRQAAPRRQGHLPGLAARPLVRARRHATRRCRSTWRTSSAPCATSGACTYFKLDANFWGAMHGGRFHDPKATRIEAYRRGMQAVLRGAGDSFILGCNHPIWASFGLIHGSRSSGDISRNWETFQKVARQNLQPQLAERQALVERSRMRSR